MDGVTKRVWSTVEFSHVPSVHVMGSISWFNVLKRPVAHSLTTREHSVCSHWISREKFRHGVFWETTLCKRLSENQLCLPLPVPLPSREKRSPYVLGADDAFPLQVNIMKSFSGTHEKRSPKWMYNYRLSRACWHLFSKCLKSLCWLMWNMLNSFQRRACSITTSYVQLL